MEIVKKAGNFVSRLIRYVIFSILLSFSVSVVLAIINLFMGVRVSLGIYLLMNFWFDLALVVLLCIYNSHKMFAPINKPLITKLERERVERARRTKRVKKRTKGKKVS